MFRGIRLSALGVTLSALVTLYGCGGGSDDGGSTPSAKGGPLVKGEAVQEARAAAAGARPVTGPSVTQSSNVGASGTTAGVVTVTVSEDRFDNLEVSVRYNGEDGVDTEHASAEAGKRLERVANREEGTRLYERFTDGVSFYRSLADEDITDVPAGDLWVHVETNFDDSDVDDTSYIAGGYWVFIPDDAEEDASFGVFVDGASHADGDRMQGLTDEAEYAGDASGVYSSRGGRKNEFFDAKVALTTDFDEADSPGNIDGEITGFVVNDKALTGDPTLVLDMAVLSDMSTSFTGDTAMMFGGDTYEGRWGGQFYNQAEDDDSDTTNDYPGTVAGTFGAATEDDMNSFIGWFNADHEE